MIWRSPKVQLSVQTNALPNYGLQLHECNARGSLQGGPEKRDQMHLPTYGVASAVECIGVFFWAVKTNNRGLRRHISGDIILKDSV